VTGSPVLDDFTCYQAKASKGSTKFPGIDNPPGIALVDQFCATTRRRLPAIASLVTFA